MKKILFINKDSIMGGSAISLLILLKKLKKLNYKIYVILCQPGALEKELIKLKIPYTIINFCCWRNLKYRLKNFSAIFSLKKFLKHNSFDLIHSNSYEVNPLAVYAKIKNIKTICHIRDVVNYKRAKKFLLHKTDMLITVSKYCSKLLGNINKNIKTVYNGVEPLQQKKYKKSISKKINVGIIGNCERRKRQKDFIAAALLILNHHKNFIFHIIGCSSNSNQYAKEMYRLIPENLKKHFKFIRFKKDIMSFLQRLNILVITSEEEAFGRTAIEAMYLKKPVIATKTGGLQEIVIHNKTGLLFNIGDIKTLAKHIEYLSRNKKLAEKFGKAGFNRVKKMFSSQIYINNIVKIYNSLLK